MNKRRVFPFGGLLTDIERFLFGSVALSVYLASLVSPGLGSTGAAGAAFAAIVACLIMTAPTKLDRMLTED